MNPRQTLKKLLQRDKLLVAPGCFDGLSARLVEEAGFEAAYLSGGAVARSMGIPDIGLVTMSEAIERAAQVVSAVNIPIIADADTGYGNAVNLVRTRARIRARRRRGDPHRRSDHAQALRPSRRQRSHLARGDGKETRSRAWQPAPIRISASSRAPTRAASTASTTRSNERASLPSSASTRSLSKRRSRRKSWPKFRAGFPGVPLLVNVFKGGKTPMLPMERLRDKWATASPSIRRKRNEPRFTPCAQRWPRSSAKARPNRSMRR